jgi:hypothetical protein
MEGVEVWFEGEMAVLDGLGGCKGSWLRLRFCSCDVYEAAPWSGHSIFSSRWSLSVQCTHRETQVPHVMDWPPPSPN